MGKFDEVKVQEAVKLLLEGIGEDVNREGLLDTPKRVMKMYKELLGGYEIDTAKLMTVFQSESSDMITLSNVPIYSFCEHHMMPFMGKIHISYIPGEKMIGLSKLARIARAHAKKLQVQERLVKAIADDIEKLLKPQGVAVQLQAQHTCTALRGVRAHGSVMTTTAVRGIFKDDEKARLEFLDTIHHAQESVNAY